MSKFDLENEAKELENYKIKLQLGKSWIGREVIIHSTLARSVLGYTEIEEIKKLSHNLRHKRKRRPVKENWDVTSRSVHWHRRAIFTYDDSMLANDVNWGINSPMLFHLLQRTRANSLEFQVWGGSKVVNFWIWARRKTWEEGNWLYGFWLWPRLSSEADSSFRDLCKRVSRNEEELKNIVMQNT